MHLCLEDHRASSENASGEFSADVFNMTCLVWDDLNAGMVRG